MKGLNFKIIKAMYKAEEHDDYQEVKKLIDDLIYFGNIERALTSRFSVWRILRTKDFYKVFTRYIIEKSKEFEDSPRLSVSSNMIFVTWLILSTTKNHIVAATFCRQLVKHKAIITQAMLQYCDESTLVTVFMLRDLRIIDSAMKQVLFNLDDNISSKDEEIKNLQEQLELYLNLN